MSPELSKSPLGPDIFSSLPAEIDVEIMKCISVHGLLSLTRGSPGALRTFQKNHIQILESHLQHLDDHYGDLNAALPLLKLLTRLRSLRARLNDKTAKDVEIQLRPILNSVVLLSFTEMPSGCESNLPVLVAASNMLPELCNVFETNKSRDCRSISLSDSYWLPGPQAKRLRERPKWDTWKFVESLLRFECFCCIFYYPKGFLVNYIPKFKDVFQRPFLLGELVPRFDMNLSSPVRHYPLLKEPLFINEYRFGAPGFFYRQYEILIKAVDQSLRSKWPKLIKRRGGAQRTTKESQVSWFLNRRSVEEEYFCHHLCLQGIALRNHLSHLHPSALNNYIVEAYSLDVGSGSDGKPKDHPDLEEMRSIKDLWH